MAESFLDTGGPDDASEPYEVSDDSRAYRAMHGRRTSRVTRLLLIPRDGEYDRFLPFADLRLIDVRKDGTELALEFSGTLVIVTGKRLRSVGNAIAGAWCACIEAFDPTRRDAPDDPAAPFIERIAFFVPKQKPEIGQSARPGRRAAAKSPEAA